MRICRRRQSALFSHGHFADPNLEPATTMQELHASVHGSSGNRWDFLTPWTALLLGHKLRVKTKRMGDDTCRFQFDAIYLNMQRNVMLDHAPHQALQTTAEAVHLVATALALFPDAWTALLVDQCDCGSHFDPSIHMPSELVSRFEFDCGHYPGEILMAKTGLRFFQVLLDATARTNQFHTAMQQLLLLAEPSGEHVHRFSPVPLKIDLSLWNEDHNILLGFMDFVDALKPFSIHVPYASSRRWCFVEAIEMDFTGPGICSHLVQRTLALVADAPLVQISAVTIDPQSVSCSRVELTQLLATLTTTYPRLHLRLGDVAPVYSGQFNYEDPSVGTSDPKLAMVLDVVASTPVVIKYVNLGHLMTSDRREAEWYRLFGTLLNSASACEIQTLALNSPRVLNRASDARAIAMATTAFPSYQMPPRLTLGLTDANHASVRAIIAAFGANLRHLSLYDRGQMIPSGIIAYILETCPKLTSIDIDNVAVDSMDLFFGVRARCQLSRLVLHNVVLRDASTLSTFLTHLAGPQSRVGGSLGEFVLSRYGHSAVVGEQLVLTRSHIQLVHNVLRSNGRVHTLQFDVDAAVPQALLHACLVQHRTPAAVRLAPPALSQKLAFLSAVGATRPSPWSDMSDDVVCNVFAFAAVCRPRWIHVKRAW